MSELKKIGVIKEELQAAEETMLPSFIAEYKSDERTGVQKMVQQAQKRLDNLKKERARIEALKVYEKEYESYGYICGIDEVGRGPLAGPVVALSLIHI